MTEVTGREAEREALLSGYNQMLFRLGLRQIPKLGDHTKGEIEITGIAQIIDFAKKFFTDIRFFVLFPNGQRGEFTVRFNANGAISDGAVMVTMLNDRFAIVKQWRLPLGRWTYEVPRGFGEKIDGARLNGKLGTIQIGDLPLGTLTRELGEEVMKDAVVHSIAHLGNIAENSGTHAVIPSCYLVRVGVDEQKVATKISGDEEAIKVILWDARRVRNELGVHIADAHSITALCLAFRHLGWNF